MELKNETGARVTVDGYVFTCSQFAGVAVLDGDAIVCASLRRQTAIFEK